jgi:hypothetical protein
MSIMWKDVAVASFKHYSGNFCWGSGETVKLPAARIGVSTPKLLNMKQECQPLKRNVQWYLVEKLIFAHLVTFLALCATEISLPYSQKAVTGFYPEIHEYGPHPHALFKIQFNIILLYTPRLLKLTFPFRFSPTIACFTWLPPDPQQSQQAFNTSALITC